jgi:DNA (cytosine-5)-methyltransferase 1
MLRVLDLFSGIGGFSLGLERTGGFKTVAFCEPARYCRAVLAKRWHGVARFMDARHLTSDKLKPFLPIDVVCGGFPCQDISQAGKKLGIDGSRSGLWTEFHRIVGELRPLYAIVENVSALLIRGIDRVLGDLAALGYDAEWHCIPASAIGAPHRRDRVWIIAYPFREGRQGPIASLDIGQPGPWGWRGEEDLLALADAPFVDGDRWPQPLLRRMDDGNRYRTYRLHALGNAVVPQIPEIIGRAILEAEGA